MLVYPIERGDSGQPEIRGYTRDYLEASSPRRQQIQAQLAKVQQDGAEAAHIAARQTRGAKIDHGQEDMQGRQRELGEGTPPAVSAMPWSVESKERSPVSPFENPHVAVTFAKARNFEREAVVDERDLLRDALRRSMGETTLDTIKAAFTDRVDAGEFIGAPSRPGAPARAFTTREMLDLSATPSR